jgi:hypothetical protein
VEGTEPGVDMRAVQVPEKADALEDDDVFVLETMDKVYVWSGKVRTNQCSPKLSQSYDHGRL